MRQLTCRNLVYHVKHKIDAAVPLSSETSALLETFFWETSELEWQHGWKFRIGIPRLVIELAADTWTTVAHQDIHNGERRSLPTPPLRRGSVARD